MKEDRRELFALRGRLFITCIIMVVFGLTRLEEEKHPGPIAIYEARLKRRPDEPKIILKLARAYYNKAIHSASSEEREQLLEKTILLYEKALSKKRDPEIFYSLGQAYFKMAQFSSKKESLKKAEDSFISSEKGGLKKKELFLYLGHLLLLRAEEDKAIEYYKKALDLSPKDPIILYNIGFCYFEKEDFERALFYLKKINKRRLPKDIEIDIRLLLAKIYEKKKDLALAKDEYERVLKKDKDNFEARSSLNRLSLIE